MSSAERTLVTGGGGFIGSHLVDRLLRDGHQVRVLDNFAPGRRENLAEAGIAELPSVLRSIQDPLTSTAANVTGTLSVLLASRDEGVRRGGLASSSSVYGADEALPKREAMAALPIAPYGVSKLAAEGYCRTFSHVYGLDAVALRYFNVFGPRQDPLSQYAAVIPLFISAFLEDERPVIYGDGELHPPAKRAASPRTALSM